MKCFVNLVYLTNYKLKFTMINNEKLNFFYKFRQLPTIINVHDKTTLRTQQINSELNISKQT